MKKLTTSQYAIKLYSVRKDSVKLIGPYKSMRENVQVVCTKCNNKTPWSKNAKSLLNPKIICPHKSSKTKLITNKDYKLRLRKLFGKDVETVTKYIDARTKIGHKCSNCNCGRSSHVWYALPQHTLKGNRCPYFIFAKKRRITADAYKKLALSFGFKQLEKFIDTNSAIKYKCLKCKTIEKRVPRTFKNNKNGLKCCTNCFNIAQPRKFSKIAIDWLESIENKQRIKIQHAKNKGEYVVPGTRMRVDGFNKSTNTIFEFYGDKFHGNPKLFNKNDICNPYSKLTASELYSLTKAREVKLKKMGYKLITIWENDYRKKNV